MDEKFELYKALLNKKRLRGLDDLYFFNKYIVEQDESRRKYIVPHVHQEWWDWYKNSKARIKLMLVPRGHFKSSIFTVGKSLQDLAKNRDERILIANANASNAKKFLAQIKTNLQYNQTFKTLYGEFYDKNLTWNEDEIFVTGRSPSIREPTITAIGVGAGLASQHYSKIYADDLMNEDNYSTRAQVDKVIDWWKRSFSLLDPEGEMLVIGTRWSYFDLYSYMMDNFSRDKVDVFVRSSYKDDGSFYFPEMFNEEKLDELKDFHGSYFFSAFYLNDPVDEDSALIKSSQIVYWSEKEHPDHAPLPGNLNIFSMCDPAVSQNTWNDYSTIVTVGVDPEDRWFVLEVRREKMTVGQLIEELFAVYNRWQPISMTIETIGQAQGLLTPIHDEENRRNTYLPLVEVKARPQIKKENRIRSVLQPRFERKKVFIKEGMHDLLEELIKFPKSKHDDIIDALTDMEEIAFAPSEDTGTQRQGTLLEERMKKHFAQLTKPKTGYVDPIMGEYY